MIRLDLTGSTVANFAVGGGSHAVDVTRGGVVCTAARKLLALGVDPAQEIDVRRDGKRVLIPCYSVGCWAAHTVVEDGEQGTRIRALRPTQRPHSTNSVARVAEHPDDKTPVSGPSIPAAE